MRRSAALGVTAGLFFAPYLTFYSFLIPFTFIAIRWPRFATVLSGSLWATYVAAIFSQAF